MASGSVENIVMKGGGEAGSANEVIGLDMMGRIDVVGDHESESSRDLEFGR